jgi:hypothetical protein
MIFLDIEHPGQSVGRNVLGVVMEQAWKLYGDSPYSKRKLSGVFENEYIYPLANYYRAHYVNATLYLADSAPNQYGEVSTRVFLYPTMSRGSIQEVRAELNALSPILRLYVLRNFLSDTVDKKRRFKMRYTGQIGNTNGFSFEEYRAYWPLIQSLMQDFFEKTKGLPSEIKEQTSAAA